MGKKCARSSSAGGEKGEEIIHATEENRVVTRRVTSLTESGKRGRSQRNRHHMNKGREGAEILSKEEGKKEKILKNAEIQRREDRIFRMA